MPKRSKSGAISHTGMLIYRFKAWYQNTAYDVVTLTLWEPEGLWCLRSVKYGAHTLLFFIPSHTHALLLTLNVVNFCTFHYNFFLSFCDSRRSLSSLCLFIISIRYLIVRLELCVSVHINTRVVLFVCVFIKWCDNIMVKLVQISRTRKCHCWASKPFWGRKTILCWEYGHIMIK